MERKTAKAFLGKNKIGYTTDMNTPIPNSVKRLFWGDNLDELNVGDHGSYIMQTILDKGDREDIKWLFSIQSKEDIRSSLPSLHLSPRSKTFWNLYLS
jgi:hypothetical protein